MSRLHWYNIFKADWKNVTEGLFVVVIELMGICDAGSKKQIFTTEQSILISLEQWRKG